MKNRILNLSLVLVFLTVFVSCSKDDSPEIIASVNNTSMSAGNFNGDVTGNGGSTTEILTWTNSQATADYNMDITASSAGTFRFVMQDADGTTVLDRTLDGSVEPDSFSGVTEAGTAGEWTVTLTLTNFNGDGSYSASSGN
ncbi:hypothetical protein [Maribacter sp. LLG6340-A2]|uniref:hypothetical protein n=1 Tax=Maribacter sp. LLG6340-A2 TaxID=3160834 RepID=UPI00386A48EA